jgi:hypothetical protein
MILPSLDTAVRQVSLDVVENVVNAVVNVDTELTSWLLYRVYTLNILVEVSSLATYFRQLLGAPADETFATARPSRVLVGEVARRDCSCSLLTRPAVSSCAKGDGGDDGEFVCDETGGKLNPVIKFVTFVARAKLEFERECELDRVFGAASPACFPNESFHLLGFFVTVGIEVIMGTNGGEVISGSHWAEVEAEVV